MACPVDGEALQQVALDLATPPKVVAHQCGCCGGAWLEREAQQVVLGTGLGVTDGPEVQRPCPSCGGSLHQVSAGQVQLEHCPKCHGLWFDHGELRVVYELIASISEDAKPLGSWR